MNNSLFSIIIPTYNRAHIISETLDSIVEQTYTNWECIIVDDGSTDTTEEVLKIYCGKDSRIQYHLRPSDKPKGANSCRNYGFENSKGEYVKWLDSDDILKRNALKEVIENNKSHNYDVLVHLLEFVNEKLIKTHKVNTIKSNNLISDYLTGKISYYISGPTWKRSFLDKQEYLFDESISNLDDWDFNLRMLYNKPKIQFINKALVKYRIHNNSLSKEIDKLNFKEIQSEVRAREKHIKLLKINKKADIKILEKFIIKRYKHILRDATVANDSYKGFFLKKLIVKQLRSYDFFGIVKALFGFFIFSVFNRGYILLK